MLSSGSSCPTCPWQRFCPAGWIPADAHFTAQGNQLQTFSVGYRDNKKYFHATKFQPGADAPYIRKMNDFLHARHHWVTLDTPELVPALYAAVDARDLPGMADVDASLLVFCRHIKPHATVALSGECADEIFGGYPHGARAVRIPIGAVTALPRVFHQARCAGRHRPGSVRG